MVLRNSTTRVLLALYLAFGRRLCCCHLLAAAACCAPAGNHESTVSRAADTHVHDDHHHDGAHQHGERARPDDHAPYPILPCDHDDSCYCGCDGNSSLLVEKSVTIDSPVFAFGSVNWISLVTTVHQPSVRPLAIGSIGPPTSLLRMHCALII